MGKHFKILSLSLLALVGVMAVSASAAQAKWLILLNEESVNPINVEGTGEEGELLVPGLALAIHCTGSTGTAHAELSNENKTLSGEAKIKFEGCEDLNFHEVCVVHSLGQSAGVIVAEGSGEVSMTEDPEEVVVNASSGGGAFTHIEYLSLPGEGECPLEEIDGLVTGEVDITVLNALQDLTLHEIHIRGLNLQFGEEEAELHMEGPEGPLPLILGSIEDEGNTFAVHLVNL